MKMLNGEIMAFWVEVGFEKGKREVILLEM